MSANTVRSLIQQGKLRAFRIGRLYRIPADAVLEYERSQEHAPRQSTPAELGASAPSHSGRADSEDPIFFTVLPASKRSGSKGPRAGTKRQR